jgi:mitogen-activated protein kinase binding protein 1
MKNKNDQELEWRKKTSGCKKLLHELPIELERVIGSGTKSNHSLTVNQATGAVAYPVGSIIWIYNPKENKQSSFLFNPNNRPFNWVTFSPDGEFLAAGEGTTRNPEIVIWKLNEENVQYEENWILKGHKLWVESIYFSPNQKYLVSLGNKFDKGLIVWNFMTKKRVTCNQLTKWVKDLSFHEEGKYFVTWGVEHLKFWYFNEDGEPIKNTSVQPIPSSVPGEQIYIMENQAADLSKADSVDFVGVAWKTNSTFVLSSDGKLFVFNENRKIEKWMNIKVERAFGITLSKNSLICSCSDGIIRFFGADTLSHIMTLPKPPALGSANQVIGKKKISSVPKENSRYGDCIASKMHDETDRIATVYSDGMILIWDTSVKEKIKVMRAFLSHNATIYDLDILPASTVEITKFVTCSTDKTIRFWNFYDFAKKSLQKHVERNIYCKELEKVIYVSDEFDHFKYKEFEAEDEASPSDVSDLEGSMQLRSLKSSPDGKHIACGDFAGNIKIYDWESSENISSFKAHEQEVVCLDYSPFLDEKEDYMLVSGSRDRLIHIYSGREEYKNVNTLEGHSSSILSVKYAFDPEETDEAKRLKLLSWGWDKTIIYRGVEKCDWD